MIYIGAESQNRIRADIVPHLPALHTTEEETVNIYFPSLQGKWLIKWFTSWSHNMSSSSSSFICPKYNSNNE